jgi:signal transduction histidine kinase
LLGFLDGTRLAEARLAMRAHRLLQRSPWSHLVLLGPPVMALSFGLMLLVHGWMRVAPILGGAALLAIAHSLGWSMRRASLLARDDVMRLNHERLHEMWKLQETLAHELKNPLASIKGLTGLCELEPERVPERLSVLKCEVFRMQRIIDELLTFSRPLTPLSLATIDVREPLAAVRDMYEGWAEDRHLTLRTTAAGAVLAACDARKVKQMLMHLVHNAIEASPRGGEVELTLARDEARVRIGVLDRGPGLPPELLRRACEAGVTTKHDGTGLGLTLARALAAQHGGCLTLRNRDGGGMAAEIALPITSG